METPVSSGTLLYFPDDSLEYTSYFQQQQQQLPSSFDEEHNCVAENYELTGNQANYSITSQDNYLQNRQYESFKTEFLGDESLSFGNSKSPVQQSPNHHGFEQSSDGRNIMYLPESDPQQNLDLNFGNQFSNSVYPTQDPTHNALSQQPPFTTQHSNKHLLPDTQPQLDQQQNQYDFYGRLTPQMLNSPHLNQSRLQPDFGNEITESTLCFDPAVTLPNNVQVKSEKPLQQSQSQNSPRSTAAVALEAPVKVKRRRRKKPPPPPEVAAAKHKAFLQRNREAASKCRTKKKYQIHDLEDEERMGRQVNQVLLDEFNCLVKEIILLREQVGGITCGEHCKGCGNHTPIQKASYSIDSRVLPTKDKPVEEAEDEDEEIEDEENEEEDENEDVDELYTGVESPLSVNGELQKFALYDEPPNQDDYNHLQGGRNIRKRDSFSDTNHHQLEGP